jgi:regulator of nonsense transcripts 2
MKKIQEEKVKKEAEEAERRRVEEEEKALQAKLEAKKAAQQELNALYQEALVCLQGVADSAKNHKQSRKVFSTEELSASRKSFETSKKSLKSDLKKCTTFVKKIKTGGAWSMRPDDIIRDIASLNLSRYVEEVVTAILESNMKVTDLPAVLALCKAMHERYATFLSTLIPGLWSLIRSKPSGETGKLRRVYVRLVTDFLLNGLTTETKQLVKLIGEVTGGKDGSYNVTDAHIVLAFVKSAGFEILDTTPSSVRINLKLVNDEVSKSENAGDAEVNSSDPDTPVLVTKEAAAKGNGVASELAELLKERAVSSEVSQVFYSHCEGAYGTLSKSLVATELKLKKMEKRCEQDRLLAGTLTESREKGLQDARKLRETLWKSVETMSDVLDLPLPQLAEEEDEEQEGGTGVEVWTKNGNEGEDADFGPFDDEETRAFYCDVPDYLTTIPPALLGLTEDQIEQRKAENLAKYGSGFGSEMDTPEGEQEVAPSTEAELEAAEKQEDNEADAVGPEGSTDQNQDTPHYKLMVLLEQELPECNRREKVDELSEKFCTNHGSSKNSRKRLSQTLLQVPRTRLDLLPYYSRMAATCSLVWPDVGQSLVVDLEQQFHGQAKFKKNQNIESRLRTARYIGELTKFRFAPPIVSIRSLRRCLDDFTGGNVDVACSLLESCGRYLYRLPFTTQKMTNIMDTMVRLSKAKVLTLSPCVKLCEIYLPI